jgi:exodeoxyribonuclease VII small subunit
MTEPTEAPASFEAALEALEAIVDRLEGGDLSLEDALAAFERGVELSRRCAKQLEAAERRVEILAQEGRELTARPFVPEEGG